MKIYRIAMHDHGSVDELVKSSTLQSFAHFSALGTWVNDRGLCPECQLGPHDYGEPLLVEWEPSSEVIGDFSWDGPYGLLFLVTKKVRRFFEDRGFGCNFFNVEYVPPEKRRRYARCVPSPYDGPEQWWALCETFADLDMEASGVEQTVDCHSCGMKDYTFRSSGIVIRRSHWNGEGMFRIRTNGKSKATFVTEEVREAIEEVSFSNIAFPLAGEIQA